MNSFGLPLGGGYDERTRSAMEIGWHGTVEALLVATVVGIARWLVGKANWVVGRVEHTEHKLDLTEHRISAHEQICAERQSKMAERHELTHAMLSELSRKLDRFAERRV